MKVVVLGSTGMLGHMVKSVLAAPNKTLEVISFDRDTFEVSPRSLNDIGGRLSHLCGFDTDYVVNCIGAIKPTFDAATDLSIPIYTNAVFPHQLAMWGNLTNTKVIHVTTDCVFDGYNGKYTEVSAHNATDSYGKSKSLGESNMSMNLRTSIIGPEFGGRKRSLLEWIKAQDGKEINGFTNHIWNGLTTLELAKCIEYIVLDNHWYSGTYHIFGEDVTKHALVEEVVYQYGLDVNVQPFEAKFSIDRTLRTIEGLNDILAPQDLDAQIGDLIEWEGRYAYTGR